jgi:hypothetical protein
MTVQERIFADFVGTQVPTEASFSRFSKQEAIKRALQSFGLCWAVGLVCVAVPVLHFVLTPAALVSGPFVALLVYKKTQTLPKEVRGEVRCRHCQQPTTFEFIHVKPPLYTVCQSCRNGYQILWPPKSHPEA